MVAKKKAAAKKKANAKKAEPVDDFEFDDEEITEEEQEAELEELLDSSEFKDHLSKQSELTRGDLPVSVLKPNEENPNEMTDAQFNMLADNIEKVGLTDPILVWADPEEEGMYRVVGGHHRLEVAKVLGFEEVPVTIIDDPEFDYDKERFQMVRHNVIKGKLSPNKFVKLFESLEGEYGEELAAEMFGFADEEEFQKLIKITKKQLPPEMQEEFQEASKEIKTIDDLAGVLNNLFAKHGDTLPYGYMIVDFGGKDSIWLRMQPKQKKAFLAIAKECKAKGKVMDDFMEKTLQLIANGDSIVLDEVLDSCRDVDLSESESEVPTLDYLDQAL